MNDFNSVLAGVPLKDGPVLLRGVPPKCRYWSFQIFLPGAKTNSPEQCLRDTEALLDPVDGGSYTIAISTAAKRPKWAGKGQWIEVPEGSKKCALCLRAYCPKPGEGFFAPAVWFGCTNTAFSGAVNAAGAVAAAGAPEELGGKKRVMGMLPAMVGDGALHKRLGLAMAINGMVLLMAFAFDAASLSAHHWSAFAALVLPLGAVCGWGLQQLAMLGVRRTYRNLSGLKGMIPNSSVKTPDPKGDLKGKSMRHVGFAGAVNL